MTLTKRLYMVAALVGVLAIAAAAITLSSPFTSAQSSPAPTGEAARLDDGKDLLPQASITIDDAIAKAKAAVANPSASDGDGETADDNTAADPNNTDGETADDNAGDNTAADPNNTDGETADDAADTNDTADSTADNQADGETNDGNDGPADGVVGEIDLEDYNGTLAFNVEIGQHDVKVDARTGDILGMGSD